MKTQLREKYKKLRKEFADKEASINAQEMFLSSEFYKASKSVFAFYSFGSEIDTHYIAKKVLSDNKILALPYMTGKPHEMVFIRINSPNELVKNKIGIYEPVYHEESILEPDESTVIIVPGLVYDLRGYRIGYGGGYYDKYLSENKYMVSVGLAYDFQITQRVPNDENDVKLNLTITDRRVISYENTCTDR